MARKRGGLAGLYDRNKSWLQYVVPAAAGVFTGGAGGALVGGLMRGLDREGKSGIGLDAAQAIRGGLEGYGMGKLGAGLGAKMGVGEGSRAAVSRMLAPKAAMDLGAGASAGASTGATSLAAPDSLGVTNTMTTPAAGPSAIGADAARGAMTAPDTLSLAKTPPKKPSMFTKGMDFLNKYQKPIEMAAKGVQAGMPNPMADIYEEQNRLARQQYEDEQQRRRNMAMLLVPMLRQQMGMPGSTRESVPSAFIYGGGPTSMQNAIDLSGATTTGYVAPATMAPGTAMGNYLEQQGLTDTTPAGVRYAQSYGRRPQPPEPMLRRGAGGYSIYDR